MLTLTIHAPGGLMPDEIDLDGKMDGKGVVYWGKAKRQSDDIYRCLAEVGGALCIVEVRLTRLQAE